MRRLEKHAVRKHNSLWHWTEAQGPLTVTKNILLMKIAKIMPLRIKNAIYRTMGMRVGKHVSIGLDATFDIFFPELITIGDETIIGYGAAVLTHEFLQKEWRHGPVRIGRRCMIGANVTILAGVTIGDDASVSAATLVDADVPAGARAYGNPMKVERKV